MKNKLTWRVTRAQAGMRLLQFLRECYPQAPSVKAIKRAIDGKLCTVNSRVETFSSHVLKENDVVVLDERAFLKEHTLSIAVLYEDKELLIVNKPPGVLSDAKEIQTLTSKKGLELVHRLDKETSGVLILAKTPEAKEKMIALFKERALCKLYLALVDGVVKQDEGMIDNYLGKKHSYQGQAIYGSVDAKRGRRAITHWKCLKRGKNASVVRCELHTGRTHQLRAHLSGLGHPILGDVQYGRKFSCTFRPKRNLLHAYSVAFKHPTTGKQLKVVAPIPLDFKEALDGLGISLDKRLA